MPIRITCPHCKRGMLVDERLAGKKGRCKACQQIITVPALPTSDSPTTQTAPVEPKSAAQADVEAEAAALFSDEPKSEEPVEVKTVDFNCPMCDEAIKLPADLAGKRAQCPECKNIIKVPELVKKDPKDWRKLETRGPSGARLPDQPELEGAWSSRTVGSVGKQSLEEAGVLAKVEKPRTAWQKYRRLVVGGAFLLVASVAGWFTYQSFAGRTIEREIKLAMEFADSPEAKPDTKAALALAAGEYYLRSGTPRPDPRTGRTTKQAPAANNQFGSALTTLRSSPQNDERDALLTDLALAEVELGGDKPATDQDLRLPWDKAQPLILASLREIHNSEAKLRALRIVAQSLREHGQSSRVLALTNQLFAAVDADKAAALAIVGLEFLKADDRQSAERAADAALQLFPKDAKDKDAKGPTVRPEVVTLALLLDKKDLPPAGDNEESKVNEQIGRAEALARQGKWDEARKESGRVEDEIGRFRARLAVAAAAADAKPPQTADVESALKSAEDGMVKKKERAWSMLGLVELALRAQVSEERVQALASQIGSTALRGRAQLAVFRAQLEKSSQPLDDAAADKIDGNSLSRSLAAQALARHNIQVNSGYDKVVQSWQQPLRSFGALGIALGLQDKQK